MVVVILLFIIYVYRYRTEGGVFYLYPKSSDRYSHLHKLRFLNSQIKTPADILVFDILKRSGLVIGKASFNQCYIHKDIQTVIDAWA